MRRWRVALVATSTLVAASTGHAAPRESWADWVGSYTGTLRWSACTSPGVKHATLALDAIDGAMHLDLAPAGAALTIVSLMHEDDGTWSARQGDLSVRVRRPRPNALDLTVQLDSGCTLSAQLRRPATGVTACDRHLGWARIESRCTKRDASQPTATDAPGSRRWRAGDAATCAKRSQEQEASLVAAGCAPHTDLSSGLGGPSCRSLAAAGGRLDRCGAVPRELKEPWVRQIQNLVIAGQSATSSTLPIVEQQCRDAKSIVESVLTRGRCP